MYPCGPGFKKDKKYRKQKPAEGIPYPNHPNTDETEVTTPWYLLVRDPLKEFEQHMRVAYDMMDEPMDDDTDDDEDEKQKN